MAEWRRIDRRVARNYLWYQVLSRLAARTVIFEDVTPYVCPGCYAFAGEPCAAFCPDFAIEQQRERDRELRDMYPEDYEEDDHG